METQLIKLLEPVSVAIKLLTRTLMMLSFSQISDQFLLPHKST
jgi:hypothetical protein